MLSIIGILLGLIVLVVMIYRRSNMVMTSLVAATVVLLFSGLPFIDSMTQWSGSFADYVKNNFLLFTFSALFGKLMEDSGAAAAFAKLIYRALGMRLAPLGCILATSLLGYAGISSFVIVFAVFPIFLAVWKEADLPRKLIPGCIFASVCSYSCGFFPGAASTINMMPISYLNTAPYAEPLIGVVSGIFTMILVLAYLMYEIGKAKKRGEHFVPSEKDQSIIAQEDKVTKNKWLVVIPMSVQIVSLNILKVHRYYALLLGCASCLLIFWKNFGAKLDTLNKGIANSVSPIVNTAAVTAFGGVVQSTAGFASAAAAMMALPFNPIVSYCLTACVVAGLCGSSTGATGILLSSLAPEYIAMGVPASVIHRVGCAAALSLDSLPYNGLVVTMLTYCGVSHKEGYKTIFVTTVVINFLGALVAMFMACAMYPI